MAREKGPDIFSELFNYFCLTRNQIAKDHHSACAQIFGAPRSYDRSTQDIVYSCTFLSDQYTEYNKIFMAQLLPFITSMQRNGLKAATTIDCCLSHTNQIDLELVSGEELQLYKSETIENEVEKLLGRRLSFATIMHDSATLHAIRSRSMTLYKVLMKSMGIEHIYRSFPKKLEAESNTTFVIGTFRFELTKKMYSMSRFFTWFDNSTPDPIKTMDSDSIVAIFHQDPFLIEDTLQVIKQMFKNALSWNRDRDSLEDLKDRTSLFRFTFVQCTPSHRGDGSIGDWLELVIYLFHGFINTKFNDDRLPCFEPLASLSLSRYRGTYDRIITISE